MSKTTLLIPTLAAVLLVTSPAIAREGRIFDRLDANGDGAITFEELQSHRDAMLERVDANGDGVVSRDEMQARVAERQSKRAERAGQRFERLDANGDGMVDRDERRAAAEARFERMDRDGDGRITREEARELREERRGDGKPGKWVDE